MHLARKSKLIFLMSGAIALIVVGTVFYVLVEGFRFIDAFYFTIMTLTTVGYGDFVPQTDLGKLFTSVYSLLGIGVVFVFIAIYADHSVERAYKKRK